MTARDEAIAAIDGACEAIAGAACDDEDYWYWGEQQAADVIDAIPADVLARLAIERGGLEEVRGLRGPNGLGGLSAPRMTVYRLKGTDQ